MYTLRRRKKMKDLPVEKVYLANLPTKIQKLINTSLKCGTDIFIKRDDQTGTELSGNKIRKLEYAIAEAKKNNCTTLITCGGIQSNHCRATAAAAVKQGMDCILVLAADEKVPPNGNLLMDYLFGADVRFVSSEEYANRDAIMQNICEELSAQRKKGYIIPMGASNGIGTFGYYNAMNEIIEQEKQLGISFDSIVCTVGSGGTYAGLCLSNKENGYGKKIIGISISESADFFVNQVIEISKEFYCYFGRNDALTADDICIIEGYAGKGYALSSPHELEFIKNFARQEAIILDPVYTGKAMYGLSREIAKGTHFNEEENILFIHTGGLFGLFPKSGEFAQIL